MTLYRNMDRAALDAGYNNSSAVSNSPALLADFDARSQQLRASAPCHLDLHYGPAPRNRIDYFPASAPGPVLLFIHGGYWQMRAKEGFSFLANGPLAHGIHVALTGYTLAPDITLGGIVAEIRTAVAWVAAHAAQYGGDPAQIYVAGWSAGGHLTAMALEEPAVKGGIAISGIFDLEPIKLSYLNDKLRLDMTETRDLSPLHRLAACSQPLVVAYGSAELPELQRQSQEFASARAAAKLPGRTAALAGHNHFSILEELASPDGALTTLLREMIAR